MQVSRFPLLLLLLCLVAGSTQAEDFVTREEFGKMVGALAEQIRMQRYVTEDQTRTSGQSGLTTVRLRRYGTKSYHSASHASFGAASMHDHSNTPRTVGLGEFCAVLNGNHFCTRHNDYEMHMPSRESTAFGATEPVPFPDVPPSVQGSLEQQMDEMRTYFRAWRDQDTSLRADYKKYFRPVLCYLEGTWINAEDSITEGFASSRHRIDARRWPELQRKNVFSAYAGSKSRGENLAFMPRTILNVINGSIPEYGQFIYRILCQPLEKDVPLDRFRVKNDLHLQVKDGVSKYRYAQGRKARFQLSPKDAPFPEDTQYERGLLDDLMGEIPGMGNHKGPRLTDPGVDAVYSDAIDWEGTQLMDTSRYHRVYSINRTEANGRRVMHRGYNDPMLFAAMNEQPEVIGMSMGRVCGWGKNTSGVTGWHCRDSLTQRWSWAIPLEIIYLTPLQKWNPLNLENWGKHEHSFHSGSRYGGCSGGNKPYNGTNNNHYFRTPAEFFGDALTSDSADTSGGTRCVLDKNGNKHRTRASGVSTFLPTIKDVGAMRIRFPVFPIHEEASTTFKEVDALKTVVLEDKADFYTKPNDIVGGNKTVIYTMERSHSRSIESHTHLVVIRPGDLKTLALGARVHTESSESQGHKHKLVLRYSPWSHRLYIERCDEFNGHCEHKHYGFSLSDVKPCSLGIFD